VTEENPTTGSLWRSSWRRLIFEMRWVLLERLAQSWIADMVRWFLRASRPTELLPTWIWTFFLPRLVTRRAEMLAQLYRDRRETIIIVPRRPNRLTELIIHEAARASGPIHVVAPTRTEAERWRGRPGIEVATVQDVWTDSATDIAIHERAGHLLDRLRQEVDRYNQPSAELIEFMYLYLHEFVVRQLRYLYVVDRLRAAGARVVYFTVSLSYWEARLLSSYLEGEVSFIPLVRRRLRFPTIGSEAHLLNDERRSSVLLRAKVARWPRDGYVRARPAADPALKGGGAPLFISDADVDSIYWRALANLLAAARKRGIKHSLLIGRAKARRWLSRKGMSARRPPNAAFHVDPTLYVDMYRDLLTCGRKLVASDALIDAKERSVAAALRAWLGYGGVFSDIGYRAYRLAGQTASWLRQQGTSAVIVLPHWSVNGWAALCAARKLGIPTVSAPAVTIAGNAASMIRWDVLDLVGSYGRQCTEALEQSGIPVARAAEVGNLSMDHVVGKSRENLSKIGRLDFAIPAGRKIVLVATGGLNPNENAFVGALLAHQWSGSPPLIVIRPHPTLGASSYRKLMDDSPPGAAALNLKGGILPPLLRADLAITDASTSGAQAIMLGRPLVVIQEAETSFPANDYSAMGVAYRVTTPDEIGPAVEKMLEKGSFWPGFSDSYARFIEAYNIHNDGKAAERMVEAIEARMRSWAQIDSR